MQLKNKEINCKESNGVTVFKKNIAKFGFGIPFEVTLEKITSGTFFIKANHNKTPSSSLYGTEKDQKILNMSPNKITKLVVLNNFNLLWLLFIFPNQKYSLNSFNAINY